MTTVSESLIARLDAEGPPRAVDVLAASRELEERAGQGEELARLKDEANAVISAAARSGAVTADFAGRNKLRLVISHWVSALGESGERMPLPNLEPLEQAVVELEGMGGDELIERVNRGEPIIGRLIEEANLSDLDDREDIKIIDCRLVGCDLSGIEIDRARLLHTIFDDCNFSGARLPGVVATSSVFRRGSLKEVRAPDSIFNGTLFESTSLRGARLPFSSLGDCRWREVDAREARCPDALFDLASLEGVRFEGASLERSVFTGATIRDAAFDEADLTDTIFSSATFGGEISLLATLDGADFSGAAGLGGIEGVPDEHRQVA